MKIKLSHHSVDRIREIYMDKTQSADKRDFCADILRRTACFDLPIDCDKGHFITLDKNTLEQLLAVVVQDTWLTECESCKEMKPACRANSDWEDTRGHGCPACDDCDNYAAAIEYDRAYIY